MVAIAALTSINATMIVGARTNYAMARDWPVFAALGRWHARAARPRIALLVQGAIALALVVFGALADDGFEAMVEFTAPVFWSFFLLVGIALFVLRARDGGAAAVPRAAVPADADRVLRRLRVARLLEHRVRRTVAGSGIGVLAVGALLPASRPTSYHPVRPSQQPP